MIENNFDEALQKTEERFKDISTTINFLNVFKETFRYQIYRSEPSRTYARTSALDMINELPDFKKHLREPLPLLEKILAKHEISSQNKILIALRAVLEEQDRLEYELKEETLINALYTIYGEKDALIQKMVIFKKLREQIVTEPFEDIIIKILNDNKIFTWFEREFLKITITEVEFDANNISPLNNDFVICIYYKVGNRNPSKVEITADKLLEYIEKPITLK